MEPPEDLGREDARVAPVTDKSSYHRSVFLFDPRLIVFQVCSESSQLDIVVPAIADYRFVHERGVVVGVDATNRDG